VHLLQATLNTDGAAMWTASTALRRMWSGFSAHAALVTSDNQLQMCSLMSPTK